MIGEAANLDDTGLNLEPLTGSVGAIVHDIDLSKLLPHIMVQSLRSALHGYGVLFFRDQDLDAERLTRFVSQFGTPRAEPFPDEAMRVGEPVKQINVAPHKLSNAVWHADDTFLPAPAILTALRAVTTPNVGGDTCWSSTVIAYDALSEAFRQMLDGLTAIHSIMPTLERISVSWDTFREVTKDLATESVHPVVSLHPESGHKSIYVNECSTTRIVELGPVESRAILDLLFAHVKSAAFSLRWRWRPNDLAFWDNRLVQHYAVADYDSERVMQSIRTTGPGPVGPMSGG